MLKIAKKKKKKKKKGGPNFALGVKFWLQSDVFCKSPIRLHPQSSPLPIKNLEKKTLTV